MKNNGSNQNNNNNDVAGIVKGQQNSNTNSRNFDHEIAVGNGGGSNNNFTIVNGVLKLADHQRSSVVATINEHLIATTIAAATVAASSGATTLGGRTPRSTISTSPSNSSTSLTVNTQHRNSPTTANNNNNHSTSLAALVNHRHICVTSAAAKIGAATLASLNTATPETGYGDGATQVDNTSQSSSRINALLHSHLQQKQQQQNHQTKESCNGCRELKRSVFIKERIQKSIFIFMHFIKIQKNRKYDRHSSYVKTI